LHRINRVLLGIAFVLVLHGESTAEPILLVELKSSGFCFDCLPEGMEFTFLVNTATAGGRPRAEWNLPVTASDVGKSFDVPADLLDDFNTVLGSSVNIGITTQFGQTPRTIHSGNFTHGTTHDVPSVERFVPVLGENLSGYRITNITQTIDELVVTPIPPRRFSLSGEHTIRIFGYAVPEPSATVLFAGGSLIVSASLRIRGPRC
jgi:hypothetical protein